MASEAGRLIYDDIAVCDSASFSVVITEALINDFARVSGDNNPLHMNDAYAETTPFHGRIAHGMIAGALFSRLVGTQLPGMYALYLSQTLQFSEPMRIGQEILIRGEVTHKTDAARTITIKTEARDKTGEKLFVRGEALVKLLK